MKKIKMKKTQSVGQKIYEMGSTYTVADIHASCWIKKGVCELCSKIKKETKKKDKEIPKKV